MILQSLLLSVLLLVEIVNSQDMRFATDCTTPNQDRGLCIELQNCAKLFNNIIQNKVETFEFLRLSACGPANEDSKRPKVCCGEHDRFVINQATTIPSNGIPPSLESSEISSTTPPPASGHTILPKICGKQRIFFPTRIFGGKQASVGEFPWLARLVHYNKYNRSGLGCGGFLIHRRYILTAAHCLVGKGIEHLGPVKTILLGVHNDTKARICDEEKCTDPPRSFDTSGTIIHEQYDSNTHKNDIALIPLQGKVNFTDFIKAICLSPAPINPGEYIVSGWGRTETDASSRTKLKVDLPKYDRARCITRYQSLGLSITDQQICAGGESGHDSCSGDSGGPLMAVRNDDMTYYAEGIVSYGNNCGREDWPGVYTYIPKYYDWIVNNIKDDLRSRSNV